MKYRWKLMDAPAGFSGLSYERFVIAFGLTETIENLEDLKTLLPSQIRPGEELPERTLGPIDYHSTKDALT